MRSISAFVPKFRYLSRAVVEPVLLTNCKISDTVFIFASLSAEKVLALSPILFRETLAVANVVPEITTIGTSGTGLRSKLTWSC